MLLVVELYVGEIHWPELIPCWSSCGNESKIVTESDMLNWCTKDIYSSLLAWWPNIKHCALVGVEMNIARANMMLEWQMPEPMQDWMANRIDWRTLEPIPDWMANTSDVSWGTWVGTGNWLTNTRANAILDGGCIWCKLGYSSQNWELIDERQSQCNIGWRTHRMWVTGYSGQHLELFDEC
jgi:hypothetical protein